MSYTPTNWQTGDVVTSAKLNKLEQGVSDAGALIVTAAAVNGAMRANKTFAEIQEAIQAGRSVYLVESATHKVYVLCKNEATKITFICVFSNNNAHECNRAVLQSNEILSMYTLEPYFKPNAGIPETDFAQAVSDKLNSSDIFIATRGITTGSEIDQAISSGKWPVVQWDHLESSGDSMLVDKLPLMFLNHTNNSLGQSYITYYFNGIYRAADTRIYDTSISLVCHPQTNDMSWGNFITTSVVESSRTINNKNLGSDITLNAGDLEFSNQATYNTGSIGWSLQNVRADINMLFDDNIFILRAEPVYDEFNRIVSYTINRNEADIYDALHAGRIVQCYIVRNDKIFNTTVSYRGSDQNGYVIDIRPIIWYAPYGDVPPFSISWDLNGDYNGVSLDPSEGRYILPLVSIDDPLEQYKVPMVDSSNSCLSIDSINEYIDFGTTVEQLIIGALGLADQNGYADISTYIDDSSTVATATYVTELCERNMGCARGAIAHFQYGLYEFYTNVSSFVNQGSTKSVTFPFEPIGTTVVGGTFTEAALYEGKITMIVHYVDNGDGTESSDYIVGVIHIDKHSAPAV